MSGKSLLRLAALAAGLLAFGSTPSRGALTLTFDAGVGSKITVVDGGANDRHSSPGAILWIGSIPGSPWFLTIGAGLGKPVVGSQFDPRLDLLVNANSTGAGTLTIELSDDGFGPFVSGAGMAQLSAGGLGGKVTVSAIVNNVSVATLGPFNALAWDGTTVGLANGLAGSFSIGERVVIEHAGRGHSGGDFEMKIIPVPEPSTVLAGLCMLLPFALGALRHFRKKAFVRLQE